MGFLGKAREDGMVWKILTHFRFLLAQNPKMLQFIYP
jgi:hypothetical protein